jgi:hypothetical protein
MKYPLSPEEEQIRREEAEQRRVEKEADKCE